MKEISFIISLIFVNLLESVSVINEMAQTSDCPTRNTAAFIVKKLNEVINSVHVKCFGYDTMK